MSSPKRERLPFAVPVESAFELQFISAAIQEPDQVVGLGLDADDFTTPATKALFHAAMTLIGQGKPVSVVTLTRWLKANQIADADAFIDEVINNPADFGVTYYAKAIRDLRVRRELIRHANLARELGELEDLSVPLHERQRRLEDDLWRIRSLATKKRRSGPTEPAAAIDALLDEYGRMERGEVSIGLSTGFAAIDDILRGLQRDALYLLAARPSMGKSALASNIALAAGRRGVGVYFVSLEMPELKIRERMLAADCEVSYRDLSEGRLTGRARDLFLQTAAEHRSLPIFVESSGEETTVPYVRQQAERLIRDRNIGLVVIDYLQLLKGVMEKNKNFNTNNEMAAVSRGLKLMAMDLGVPVLALSQLSRGVESRDDKRPQLSDLRDSGALEQDADSVAFLYREEFYLKSEEPKRGTDEKSIAAYGAWESRMAAARGKAEVIIAKNRGGQTGTAHINFNGYVQRFIDLSSASDDTPFMI